MNKTINSLYRLREPEGLEEMHLYTEKDIIIKLNEEVGYHIPHRLQYQLGRPKKQSLFYKEKKIHMHIHQNANQRCVWCQGYIFWGWGLLIFFSTVFNFFALDTYSL